LKYKLHVFASVALTVDYYTDIKKIREDIINKVLKGYESIYKAKYNIKESITDTESSKQSSI